MSSATHHNAHKVAKEPPQGLGTGSASVELTDYMASERLQPKLGFWAAVALGTITTSSYIAFSASLYASLTGGGPVAMFWGYFLSLVLGLVSCLSLAECAGIWTTAGGQIDWVYMMSNEEWAPALSYFSGWLTIIGYICLGLGGEAVVSQALVGMANMGNPNYTIETWNISLIACSVTLVCTAYGAIGARLFNKTNLSLFPLFLATGVTYIVVLFAESSGHFNSGSFAFTDFINETGWNNRVVPFLTGLSTSAFSVIAFDSVAHMSEEIDRPAHAVPRAMMLAFVGNQVIAIIFVIALIFTMSTDVDSIIGGTTGYPYLQMLFQATNSRAGAVVLLVPSTILFLQATANINISASRAVYSFARSEGFPFPSVFSKINVKLDVPLQATLVVTAIQLPLLWIYVGNTNAFTAFITMPAEALYLSYGLPAFLMLVRGRRLGLDKDSTFRLGPVLGPICNILTVVWSVCLTVFLILPPTYPVDAGNMNYSCLIIGALLLFSLAFWYIRGRKHYKGPADLLMTLQLQEKGYGPEQSSGEPVRDEEQAQHIDPVRADNSASEKGVNP